MRRKQLIPVVVLALSGVVIAYGFVHAVSGTGGMPAGLLIAMPAILLGRLAWRRLALSKDTKRD